MSDTSRSSLAMSKRQKLSNDTATVSTAVQSTEVPEGSERSADSSVSSEAAGSASRQTVHNPLLTDCNAIVTATPADSCDDDECFCNHDDSAEAAEPQEVSALPEETCPVASGWTSNYCSWWQEQAPQNTKHILFPAQLIGDASTPDLYTPMTFGDLACCSKWGQRLVEDHTDKNQWLPAVLPVLTAPDIVQQSIAGMLAGQIQLSESNVEAVLVLANAVGFEALEETCLTYLCTKTDKLNPEALLSLIKLADHIGNQNLFCYAAEALVKRRWCDSGKAIISLIKDLHSTDVRKLNELLHHANRGAVSELELLGLMEYAKLPEDAIAAMLDLDVMQAAEIEVLLAVLVNDRHTGHQALLRRAVQQQLKCRQTQHEENFADNRRILSNVLVPEQLFPNAEPERKLELPKSPFWFWVQVFIEADDDLFGLHLCCDQIMHNVADEIEVFALHSRRPYVRSRIHKVDGQLHRRGFGGRTFLNQLSQSTMGYDNEWHKGPYTLGVKWTGPKEETGY